MPDSNTYLNMRYVFKLSFDHGVVHQPKSIMTHRHRSTLPIAGRNMYEDGVFAAPHQGDMYCTQYSQKSMKSLKDVHTIYETKHTKAFVHVVKMYSSPYTELRYSMCHWYYAMRHIFPLCSRVYMFPETERVSSHLMTPTLFNTSRLRSPSGTSIFRLYHLMQSLMS